MIGEGDPASKVQDLFKEWDSKCRGIIGSAELRLLLRKLQPSISEQKLNNVLSSVDRLGTGKISYTQLIDWAFREVAPSSLLAAANDSSDLFTHDDDERNLAILSEQFSFEGRVEAAHDRGMTCDQFKRVISYMDLVCHKMVDMAEESETAGQKLSMHSVNLHHMAYWVIRPATKQEKCSFMELLSSSPQPCDWFLSHSWGDNSLETLSCMENHLHVRGLDPKTAYWISAYALCQHFLCEQGLNFKGDPKNSDFYNAMVQASFKTLLILDERATPFARIWCMLEEAMCCERPELPLDISTHAHGTVHLITSGLTKEEKKQECQTTDELAWQKQERERDFPLEVIRLGFDIHIEKAEATVEDDRSQILNCIAGQQPTAKPLLSHAKYDEVNRKISSLFAMAFWQTAEIRRLSDSDPGLYIELVEAMCSDHWRKSLQFPFLGSMKLPLQTLIVFGSHLPPQLEHLSLDFQGSEVQDSGLVGMFFALPRMIRSLSLDISRCRYVSDGGLAAIAKALPPDLEELELNLSGNEHLSDEGLAALRRGLDLANATIASSGRIKLEVAGTSVSAELQAICEDTSRFHEWKPAHDECISAIKSAAFVDGELADLLPAFIRTSCNGGQQMGAPVRQAVIRALRAVATLPKLLNLLNDADSEVRTIAAQVLLQASKSAEELVPSGASQGIAQLDKQLEESEVPRQVLPEELESRKGGQAAGSEAGARISELEQQLAQESKAAEEQRLASSARIAELEEEIIAAKSRATAHAADLESQQGANSARIVELEAELASKARNADAVAQQLQASETYSQTLQDELARIKGDASAVSDRDARIGELEEQLSQEVQAAEQLKLASSSRIAELQEELEHLKGGMAAESNAIARATELEKQQQASSSRIEELEADRVAQQQQLEETETRCKVLQEELESVKRGMLDSSEAVGSEAVARIEELEKLLAQEMSAAEEQKVASRSRIAQLEEELECSKGAMTAGPEALACAAELEKQQEASSARIAELETELLSKANATTTSNNDSIAQQLQECEARNQALQDELTSIKAAVGVGSESVARIVELEQQLAENAKAAEEQKLVSSSRIAELEAELASKAEGTQTLSSVGAVPQHEKDVSDANCQAPQEELEGTNVGTGAGDGAVAGTAELEQQLAQEMQAADEQQAMGTSCIAEPEELECWSGSTAPGSRELQESEAFDRSLQEESVDSRGCMAAGLEAITRIAELEQQLAQKEEAAEEQKLASSCRIAELEEELRCLKGGVAASSEASNSLIAELEAMPARPKPEALQSLSPRRKQTHTRNMPNSPSTSSDGNLTFKPVINRRSASLSRLRRTANKLPEEFSERLYPHSRSPTEPKKMAPLTEAEAHMLEERRKQDRARAAEGIENFFKRLHSE